MVDAQTVEMKEKPPLLGSQPADSLKSYDPHYERTAKAYSPSDPIVEKLREQDLLRADTDVPVLMLTARDTLKNKLEGFESGADDFVAKPINMPEFLARVDACLRRPANNAEFGRPRATIAPCARLAIHRPIAMITTPSRTWPPNSMNVETSPEISRNPSTLAASTVANSMAKKMTSLPTNLLAVSNMRTRRFARFLTVLFLLSTAAATATFGGSQNYELYLKAYDGNAWVELGGSASGGGVSDNPSN